MAAILATAYAKGYISYRHELDTKSLVQARQEIERRVSLLRAKGDGGSQLFSGLPDKDQRLRTTEPWNECFGRRGRERRGADPAAAPPRDPGAILG
jgi:hypothetical protein